MPALRSVRPADPDAPPVALHEHAIDSLRFIRRTMEDASRFSAVSGSGEIAVGVTALAAAALAARQASAGAWIAVWLAEAALALALSAASIVRKARRLELPLWSPAGRRFALGLGPSLVAGAVLTPVLFAAGLADRLPGMWLLLYGTGVLTGGAFSLSPVMAMGATLMATGVAALALPGLGNLLMAVGFGGVHVVGGLVIARRHGG